MHPSIQQKLPELQRILKEHKVTRAYLFGSAIKAEFQPDSDVDVLVNFEEHLDPVTYSDNYFDLLFSLQQLFNRDIDLVNEKSLNNPYLIKSIRRSREIVL